MNYIAALIYCAVTTGVYFPFFYREDISVVASFAMPFVFFLPILLSITKSRPKLYMLNLVTIIAFCISFVVVATYSNNNFWPIALGAWLALSVLAITVLNIISIIIIKTHNKAFKRDAEKASRPLT